MKLGIILNSNDPERIWNALRLGAQALEDGNDVNMFLLGAGVEMQEVKDPTFDIAGSLEKFLDCGGRLLACGTCVEARQLEAGICPISTMFRAIGDDRGV